jgi:hypothetical protein
MKGCAVLGNDRRANLTEAVRPARRSDQDALAGGPVAGRVGLSNSVSISENAHRRHRQAIGRRAQKKQDEAQGTKKVEKTVVGDRKR